jgi:hypothetical protein
LAATASRAPIAAMSIAERPALAALGAGLDELRLALERERFAAMDADAARLGRYVDASAAYARAWPDCEREAAGQPLRAAHRAVVSCAERWLPTAVTATGS